MNDEGVCLTSRLLVLNSTVRVLPSDPLLLWQAALHHPDWGNLLQLPEQVLSFTLSFFLFVTVWSRCSLCLLDFKKKSTHRFTLHTADLFLHFFNEMCRGGRSQQKQ